METATIAWLERRELTDTLASHLPNRTHSSAFLITPKDKHSALRLTLRIPFRLWGSRLVASRGSGIRGSGISGSGSSGGGSSGGCGSSGGGSRSLAFGKHPAPEAAAWRRI